ncbi:MAG TPA: hypothetical protein VKU39_18890 [Streptosporangiaceae bacterium]|nr:hypothetical protein [Streptosporangiaceae bacterium]
MVSAAPGDAAHGEEYSRPAYEKALHALWADSGADYEINIDHAGWWWQRKDGNARAHVRG